MTIQAGRPYDHITEADGRAALDRFIARARVQAGVYTLLVRCAGRGRPVAHLIAADGTHPLCGARLNDDLWDVARVTTRRVCRRCLRLKASG